jgi:curved DNA-binding protein CbpA
MKDYYQILEISHNATQDEIQASFARLSKMYHPDSFRKVTAHLNEEQQKAFEAQLAYFTEKFLEIKEAKEVLSNSKKRAEYDKKFGSDSKSSSYSPVVEISPSTLGFGSLNVGDVASNVFIVNFTGNATEINFSPYPENIFSIGAINSVGDQTSKQTFPLEVEVVADTKQLSPANTYKGAVKVHIDDFEAKVNLILKTSTDRSKTTPLKPKDSVAPSSFRFRSGDAVYSPEELIPFCDQYWAEAREYLYDSKQFKKWFVDLRRNDMVGKLEICTRERSRDVGLEKFLQSIKPDLAKPFIEVSAHNTHLENYNYETSSSPSPKIEIINKGRGCCYGNIEINAPWLSISYKDFAIAPGETHTLEFRTNSHELVWETSHPAKVEIVTNSQNIPKQSFDFFVSTAKYPLLSEIEALRDQGKWQLAFEKLNGIDSRHANAEKLKQSIQHARNSIRVYLLIGTALIYGFMGGVIIGGSSAGNYSGSSALEGFFVAIFGFIMGGLAGGLLGAVAALIYFEKWGGKNGKEIDYLLGGLALPVVAVGLVAAWYIILFILAILFLFGFLSGAGG